MSNYDRQIPNNYRPNVNNVDYAQYPTGGRQPQSSPRDNNIRNDSWNNSSTGNPSSTSVNFNYAPNDPRNQTPSSSTPLPPALNRANELLKNLHQNIDPRISNSPASNNTQTNSSYTPNNSNMNNISSNRNGPPHFHPPDSRMTQISSTTTPVSQHMISSGDRSLPYERSLSMSTASSNNTYNRNIMDNSNRSNIPSNNYTNSNIQSQSSTSFPTPQTYPSNINRMNTNTTTTDIMRAGVPPNNQYSPHTQQKQHPHQQAAPYQQLQQQSESNYSTNRRLDLPNSQLQPAQSSQSYTHTGQGYPNSQNATNTNTNRNMMVPVSTSNVSMNTQTSYNRENYAVNKNEMNTNVGRYTSNIPHNTYDNDSNSNNMNNKLNNNRYHTNTTTTSTSNNSNNNNNNNNSSSFVSNTQGPPVMNRNNMNQPSPRDSHNISNTNTNTNTNSNYLNNSTNYNNINNSNVYSNTTGVSSQSRHTSLPNMVSNNVKVPNHSSSNQYNQVNPSSTRNNTSNTTITQYPLNNTDNYNNNTYRNNSNNNDKYSNNSYDPNVHVPLMSQPSPLVPTSQDSYNHITYITQSPVQGIGVNPYNTPRNISGSSNSNTNTTTTTYTNDDSVRINMNNNRPINSYDNTNTIPGKHISDGTNNRDINMGQNRTAVVSYREENNIYNHNSASNNNAPNLYTSNTSTPLNTNFSNVPNIPNNNNYNNVGNTRNPMFANPQNSHNHESNSPLTNVITSTFNTMSVPPRPLNSYRPEFSASVNIQASDNRWSNDNIINNVSSHSSSYMNSTPVNMTSAPNPMNNPLNVNTSASINVPYNTYPNSSNATPNSNFTSYNITPSPVAGKRTRDMMSTTTTTTTTTSEPLDSLIAGTHKMLKNETIINQSKYIPNMSPISNSNTIYKDSNFNSQNRGMNMSLTTKPSHTTYSNTTTAITSSNSTRGRDNRYRSHSQSPDIPPIYRKTDMNKGNNNNSNNSNNMRGGYTRQNMSASNSNSNRGGRSRSRSRSPPIRRRNNTNSTNTNNNINNINSNNTVTHRVYNNTSNSIPNITSTTSIIGRKLDYSKVTYKELIDHYNIPVITRYLHSLSTIEVLSRFPKLYIPADFVRMEIDWKSIFEGLRNEFFRQLYITADATIHTHSPVLQNKPHLLSNLTQDTPKINLIYPNSDMPAISSFYNTPTMYPYTGKPIKFNARILLTMGMNNSEIERVDFTLPKKLKVITGKRKSSLLLLGGTWNRDLDGGDPLYDRSCLLNTVRRTLLSQTVLDISVFTHYIKIGEIVYQRPKEEIKGKLYPEQDEITAIYLCSIIPTSQLQTHINEEMYDNLFKHYKNRVLGNEVGPLLSEDSNLASNMLFSPIVTNVDDIEHKEIQDNPSSLHHTDSSKSEHIMDDNSNKSSFDSHNIIKTETTEAVTTTTDDVINVTTADTTEMIEIKSENDDCHPCDITIDVTTISVPDMKECDITPVKEDTSNIDMQNNNNVDSAPKDGLNRTNDIHDNHDVDMEIDTSIEESNSNTQVVTFISTTETITNISTTISAISNVNDHKIDVNSSIDNKSSRSIPVTTDTQNTIDKILSTTIQKPTKPCPLLCPMPITQEQANDPIRKTEAISLKSTTLGALLAYMEDDSNERIFEVSITAELIRSILAVDYADIITDFIMAEINPHIYRGDYRILSVLRTLRKLSKRNNNPPSDKSTTTTTTTTSITTIAPPSLNSDSMNTDTKITSSETNSELMDSDKDTKSDVVATLEIPQPTDNQNDVISIDETTGNHNIKSVGDVPAADISRTPLNDVHKIKKDNLNVDVNIDPSTLSSSSSPSSYNVIDNNLSDVSFHVFGDSINTTNNENTTECNPTHHDQENDSTTQMIVNNIVIHETATTFIDESNISSQQQQQPQQPQQQQQQQSLSISLSEQEKDEEQDMEMTENEARQWRRLFINACRWYDIEQQRYLKQDHLEAICHSSTRDFSRAEINSAVYSICHDDKLRYEILF